MCALLVQNCVHSTQVQILTPEVRRPHAGARGQRVGDTHILPVAVPKAAPVSQMELKKEVITYADVCCLTYTDVCWEVITYTDVCCVSDGVEKGGDYVY